MDYDQRMARFAASRERIVLELLQASEGSPMHHRAVDYLVRATVGSSEKRTHGHEVTPWTDWRRINV